MHPGSSKACPNMGLINGFARGKHFVIPAEKIRENERKIRSQK